MMSGELSSGALLMDWFLRRRVYGYGAESSRIISIAETTMINS